MRQWLIKALKVIFSDIRQAIISIIVGVIALSIGGVYLFAKNVWLHLKAIMQSPTPLWVAILLAVLCCLYTYLKASQYLRKKIQSSLNPPNAALIEIGNFKWNLTIFKNGGFEIHPIPYCKIHETRFVPFKQVYICPAYPLGCHSAIKKEDLKLQQDVAHSFIEHKLKPE
jgi:vacuolar-type H+-ATPase subunit I/STV1